MIGSKRTEDGGRGARVRYGFDESIRVGEYGINATGEMIDSNRAPMTNTPSCVKGRAFFLNGNIRVFVNKDVKID